MTTLVLCNNKLTFPKPTNHHIGAHAHLFHVLSHAIFHRFRVKFSLLTIFLDFILTKYFRKRNVKEC